MILLFPLGLLALLALPLIVVLHLVRQRRTRLKVPTLVLWQALVTPPPERRKRWIPLSWLLLLHLAVAGLLALALANPAFRALFDSSGPQHTVLIIDTSTSMAATDESPSRLAAAQAEAADLIDELGPGDSLAVVELNAAPRLLMVGDGDSRASLDQAVAQLRAAGNGADVAGALNLASSTFRLGQANRVVVFTDDSLSATAIPLSIAAELDWRTFGATTSNAAIVAFESRRLADSQVALYGRVVNWGSSPAIRTLRLSVDGQQLDQQSIRVPEQGATEYTWRVPAASQLAELSLDSGDSLPDDDRAALPLARSRSTRVRLVSSLDSAVERVLGVLPGLQVSLASTIDPAAPPVDLTVLVGVLPLDLPAGPLLLINPPDDPRLPSKPLPANRRAESIPTDPEFQGIDLSSVQWRRLLDLGAPATTLSSTLVPAIRVADSNVGLVLRGTWQGHPTIVWAFDVDQSNLPVKLAFPLLTAASVKILTGNGLPATLAPGNHAPLPGLLRPDGTPLVAGERLDEPGFYRVRESAGTGGVAVNFGDLAESNLTFRPQPEIRAAPAAITITQPDDTRRQLWPWLIALAVLLVSAEWYLVQRRPAARR